MQTRLKQAEIKLTKMTTFTKEFKQLQEQLKQAGLVNNTIILQNEKLTNTKKQLQTKNSQLEEHIQTLNKQIFLNNNMGLNPFQKITVLEEALKEKDVGIQKAEKDKECLKIIVKKQSVEIRRL